MIHCFCCDGWQVFLVLCPLFFVQLKRGSVVRFEPTGDPVHSVATYIRPQSKPFP
jgi:hypothetical protein